ncbi:MAG: hypothetical protein EBZ61_09155 [Micrococcales bacterium]|nr:hypothetical protein [Micrococcales bacterium]
MAHFAEIDENGIVLRVLVVDNAQESNGQDFLANTLGLGGTWVKTSYNTVGGVHNNGGTPLRKNYAGIGYTYDSDRDAFIPPKPYASWILNEDSCLWEAPVAYPTDGALYTWNEETTSWDLVPTE